ncbi:hypothetical protein CLOLEP_01843 [[Clostridium] leptum DSM 753]|uniref:Uncharacterized protein n=1 Tax=[Clostridium] leptum DSM 753 TaxID=428125 RepID=A7VTF1_9FIRM|nr:hypothetical protein CLOLEP_01843 [[Clostridium] leptum DSM 753]
MIGNRKQQKHVTLFLQTEFVNRIQRSTQEKRGNGGAGNNG